MCPLAAAAAATMEFKSFLSKAKDVSNFPAAHNEAASRKTSAEIINEARLAIKGNGFYANWFN